MILEVFDALLILETFGIFRVLAHGIHEILETVRRLETLGTFIFLRAVMVVEDLVNSSIDGIDAHFL